MKEKTKRPMTVTKAVKLKNGSIMLKGTCDKCGCNMCGTVNISKVPAGMKIQKAGSSQPTSRRSRGSRRSRRSRA